MKITRQAIAMEMSEKEYDLIEGVLKLAVRKHGHMVDFYERKVKETPNDEREVRSLELSKKELARATKALEIFSGE